MKRVALLRRRLYRPPRRPEADKVTPELVEALWRRDGGCVAAQITQGHQCTDRWGIPHAWNRRDLVTVEHFWPDYARKGDRAPSDLDHTVLLCAGTNIGGPGKVMREKFRDWVKEKSDGP